MESTNDILSRFDKRMAEVDKPILAEYPAEISLHILTTNSEEAEETLKVLAQHLNRFSDIVVDGWVLK